MEQTLFKEQKSGDKAKQQPNSNVLNRRHNSHFVSVNEYYAMNHKYRGRALIYNHDEYEEFLELNPRSGSRKDCENLQKVLQYLGFSVEVFHNLCYNDIMKQTMQEAKQNHSKNDCFAVFVLSHGTLGMVYAKDVVYKLEKMWCHFTESNCPTLAGKPKLFFIQACQGEDYDDGITLSRNIETDGWYEPQTYPNEPDFLVALSTTPGYFSWRNSDMGSYFIQNLCSELYHASDRDILTILTYVSQNIALNFESNTRDPKTSRKKQIPCIMSTLTRRLVFIKKTKMSHFCQCK